MNREQMVYVRSVVARPTKRHPLTFAVSQGADADDFNPDRFMDENGQVTPPLADTKDGGFGFGEKSFHSLTHLLSLCRR